ncbi:unnamed protein product [Effrenium voratum]|uniref:Uncharacterized protein n=1 Tax=Effrenium voratum TaxID=2562239 RepID=A0AA36MQ17_9DINO|nr:unnamed protein product [Effrenium voratum]CAJ1375838.1 unnamed protein product [Effrenium voratum]CAJ1416482.1 unnamed protein product [Effrenium voratum]|mmetsp:Transcript_77259/g.185034  ORF Transcript_77259/g.185034 Transcript_77259/m.185034 type:complete len:416 (-) Transcript_77259:148-1395(-)
MTILTDEPNYQQDPESVFYVHAGTGWGSFPEAVKAAPKIYVGSFDHEKDSRRSRGSDPAWVRVEVAKELLHGDSLMHGQFEQCWSALVRTAERPPQRAPRFGSPWPCEEEVSPRQWLERAGFAVFLRAIGAAERGQAVPGTPEELRRRCGVVAVEDDGFCGFWCLAYLLGMDLSRALETVIRELDSVRSAAADARADGRRPSPEDRAWERLWNIADIKLRCLRHGIRGSHLDIVSSELRCRGLQDTNCFLTHSELSLLCGRLWRWTPVVEVTPDFHASEETGDHTMLALAAAGHPTLEAMQENLDGSEEALREAGWRLHEQGFRLITAEPVAEGRPADQPRPSFEELRQMRPLIIHLGTHYFLLDSIEDIPESLSMEQVPTGADRGFFEKCGRCFTRCLDRWWHGASEARTPLRP